MRLGANTARLYLNYAKRAKLGQTKGPPLPRFVDRRSQADFGK